MMKRLFSRQLFAVACGALAAILVWYCMAGDLLTRIGKVVWTVQHEAPLQVSVALQARYPELLRNHAWESVDFAGSGAAVAKFEYSNYPMTYFTSRFVGREGRWDIESVKLSSAFGHSIVLRGEAILAHFYAPDNRSTLALEGGRVVVSGTDGTAEIFARGLFQFSNPLTQYGLPLVAGFSVFLLAFYVRLNNLPSFQLLNRERVLASGHSLELDGLRGIAAISVVADHTWGMFTGAGTAGVWIFFALSGYLLSIPFVKKPSRIFDFSYVGAFYIRRLARIVPLYYLMLFIYFLASGRVHDALPHFLFLQGDGHFWTIVQEMMFYLLLPVVMLLMGVLMRLGWMIAMVGLTIMTLLLLYSYGDIPISLRSIEYLRPPYLGWFMTGVFVSYLLNRERVATKERFYHRIPQNLIGLMAVAVIASMMALASTHFANELTGANRSYAHTAKVWYAFGAAFLVFAAITAKSSLYGVILRWKLLRSFGVLGYSVYLIHPMLLGVVMKFLEIYHMNLPIGSILFVTVMAVTWVMATLTYNLIEHPFLSYRVDTQKTLATTTLSHDNK